MTGPELPQPIYPGAAPGGPSGHQPGPPGNGAPYGYAPVIPNTAQGHSGGGGQGTPPGQFGSGQYGPGQYGPGQYGPGQYSPGQYGPGNGGPPTGPKKSSRPLVLAIAGAAVVVIAIIITVVLLARSGGGGATTTDSPVAEVDTGATTDDGSSADTGTGSGDNGTGDNGSGDTGGGQNADVATAVSYAWPSFSAVEQACIVDEAAANSQLADALLANYNSGTVTQTGAQLFAQANVACVTPTNLELMVRATTSVTPVCEQYFLASNFTEQDWVTFLTDFYMTLGGIHSVADFQAYYFPSCVPA